MKNHLIEYSKSSYVFGFMSSAALFLLFVNFLFYLNKQFFLCSINEFFIYLFILNYEFVVYLFSRYTLGKTCKKNSIKKINSLVVVVVLSKYIFSNVIS